ncbi:MAG: putative metal-binding motif-containing protein [Thermoanaerobaculia bacterium]
MNRNCSLGSCAPVDADGDGHNSIATGGDDCADTDMNRYPSNIEICDPAMHDEDCDLTTLGVRDLDFDGHTDDGCCNTDFGGNLICGTDCDDAAAGVHPGSQEVCNGIDDNCDGTVDEELRHPAWLDIDGDGWGDSSAVGSYCSVPSTHAARAGDCALQLDFAHPGALELCNGIDDDCDGIVDEGYPTPCS